MYIQIAYVIPVSIWADELKLVRALGERYLR